MKNLDGMDQALFFEGSPVATFIINANHVVTHMNKACATTLGISAQAHLGKGSLGKVFYGYDRPVMADLIVDGAMKEIIDDFYQNKYRASLLIADAYEAEGFFPTLGHGGRWLFFTAAPLRNALGEVVGAIETLQDISERKIAEAALLKAQTEIEEVVEQRTAQLAEVNHRLREDVAQREAAERSLLNRNNELNMLNAKLTEAHEHLIQSEKLASIGQLAAGVAHEINNPIGYIFSNFGTLEKYLLDLFQMLETYARWEEKTSDQNMAAQLKAARDDVELDFLKEDIPVLMKESREGLVRVREIVQNLKDFSHVDQTLDWQFANLNVGIETTLNVVHNEVKYKADVRRELGDISEVQCMPSQINQVVMNLIVNAAHAMGPERGVITLRSGETADHVWFEVADNGCGIPPDVLPKIFDPFYTTKPIGKGTGLGLSLSYGIVQKHGGTIDVKTELGKGTNFRITLPKLQPPPASSEKWETT